MNDSKSAGRTPPFTPGCGFLSTGEIEAILEGRFPDARRQEFDKHIESPCSQCVTLAADLSRFRQIVVSGPSESERRAEESLAEPLRDVLQREIRRRGFTR